MTSNGNFWRTCWVGIVAMTLLVSSGFGVEPGVDREIELLLEKVAESGCDFERNGSLHSSTDAASHLALKYERGERYVNTTEDFISRLASKSSWSGRAYWVICEGERTPSGDWLGELLVEVRAGQ